MCNIALSHLYCIFAPCHSLRGWSAYFKGIPVTLSVLCPPPFLPALSHLLSSYLSGFKSGPSLHPSHDDASVKQSTLPGAYTYHVSPMYLHVQGARIWPPCCRLLSHDRSSLSPVSWECGRASRDRFPASPPSTSRIQTARLCTFASHTPFNVNISPVFHWITMINGGREAKHVHLLI